MQGKHSSLRCKQTNCPSMLLGSEHREGQKSVPKTSQIPAAEALSDWQCLPPSCLLPQPPSLTPPLLLLPLPPHLLLFPLWPASVVCLGWLIIRDTKILLSPPPFLSAEMSHFLARASVAGLPPGDTLLFIAPFPPQKRGAWEGVFRGVYTHTYTHMHWNSQRASTQIQIHQRIHTKTHTYREKPSMLRHTHFLAWF